MANMKISKNGIALIKSFEECRLKAYKAVSTEKYYTIGWGHYGADVKAGQTISQEEADALLLTDIQKYVGYVNSYVKSFAPNQNQFDALTSFCYNCGAGNLKRLVSDRTAEEVAKHITEYNKSGGKVLNGLVRRRNAEKELFCKGMEVSVAIIVGSARIDENGKISGGAAGDQTGKEVCTQAYYMHSKGWYLYRAKDAAVAGHLASAMLDACENDNIGYDQGERSTVISQLERYGTLKKIATKAEADCSSLVRACCIEAGFDPGNFNTVSEGAALNKTRMFESRKSVTSSTELFNGDVLVTKTKGHTVIVVSGNTRRSENISSTAISTTLQPAQSKDSRLSGTYETTTNLNLRYGPDSSRYASKVVMPKGTKFRCYGYYSEVSGEKWLYGIAAVNGKQYTGFASMGKNGGYIKK